MKKKGFTLVELLAVIVVLAIIAVIAVPIVLNVISKSKKGAAIDSAYSYVDAVEKYIVMHDMDESKYPIDLKSGEIYQVSSSTYTETSSINLIEKVYAEYNIILNDIISIKGTKPNSGVVTISEKRKVGKAILIIDSYKVICENGKCNIDGELVSTEEPKPSTEPVETCEYEIGYVWDFDYNGTDGSDGSEQIFEVPCNGTYKLEVWGAQGGGYSNVIYGGYGAYSVGLIETDDTILYINVGGQGQGGCQNSVCKGGYNGGGNAPSGSQVKSAGGGATHISLISGLLKNLEVNKGTLVNNSYYISDDILIVAGGGGGSGLAWSTSTAVDAGGQGGHAGGISGNKGLLTIHEGVGYGGTQITPGNGDCGSNNCLAAFGTGGTGDYNSYGGMGGGAGFFGGGGSYRGHTGAGGGSSYIASSHLISSNSVIKHMTCYNCTISDETETKTFTTTNVSEEATSDYAKQGNGYAKITLVG